jgi:hypothetical protein
MDNETKRMLQEQNAMIQETLELARTNAKHIKKIRAHIRRGFWARIIYWVVIILITAGAIYAVKPYIDNALGQYQQIRNQVEQTSNYIQHPEQFFINAFSSEDNTDIIQEPESEGQVTSRPSLWDLIDISLLP